MFKWREQKPEEFILKVGSRSITKDDFKNAFEIAKIEYPTTLLEKKDIINEIKIKVLTQLVEETIILEKASELNVKITEKELLQAINQIKNDYEKDAFEQIFIESAISFKMWKKRIERKLIVDKIIETKLVDLVDVDAEQLKIWYTDRYIKRYQGKKKNEAQKEMKIDDNIIKKYKIEKARGMYGKWINAIKKNYPIKVNQAVWDHVINS